MKKEIRKALSVKRGSLTAEERREKSHSILTHLQAAPEFQAASCIMVYMDFKGEVQTEALIQYLLSVGKRVALPVVKPDKTALVLVEIQSLETDFKVADYGMKEPIIREDHLLALSDLDLILAPGLGFDDAGYRIGYGGGYYDKLLTDRGHKPVVWALAFDLQRLPVLPVEDHDQPLDGIVTESGITRFNTVR